MIDKVVLNGDRLWFRRDGKWVLIWSDNFIQTEDEAFLTALATPDTMPDEHDIILWEK